MYKKQEFAEGAFYHVTSRTNDKIRVFENNLGRKIMLMTLQDAKSKFGFRLANFCIMPTHIHLLIQPAKGTDLSAIMHRIKLQSAKRWNYIHGSKDHMWGSRFFARIIKDPQEYDFVMNYIDQNPVAAGLAETPEEWKASGAFYKTQNLPGVVDFPLAETQNNRLYQIPLFVSWLLPPAQLDHITKYLGAYIESIERLKKTVPGIPGIGKTENLQTAPIYLHFFTRTADYFICEYDGEDTLVGKSRFSVYPAETEYRKFSLSALKKNRLMELDLSWLPE